MSKFDANAITWFEIPTTDIGRARCFYERVLGRNLFPYPGARDCFMFPVVNGGVGGCLTSRPDKKPTTDGTVIFLNVDGQLNATVERAQNSGSKLLVPRTEIPGGFGFFACITDSEGNHIGLHSRGN